MADGIGQLSHFDQRVRELLVDVGGAAVGKLQHDATYVFTYQSNADTDCGVSLTMPVRTRSYERGALFPIFEMNLPEGFVRRYASERLRKIARVDDMLFLALAGDGGVGRLAYRLDGFEAEPLASESLDELLAGKEDSYFATLVERYLLRTTAGFGGVQPKVVVPETRGTAVLPTLIVKAAGEDYPGLAVNEFLCMSIARHAGMPVPEFWLSEDATRFVMRRFDLDKSGARLGMEDFSVLTGRSGDRKYEGSYEHLFKAAALWRLDIQSLFERLALSIVVGDGDAHLKNFAVVYASPDESLRLSPVYDVVCTRPYGDDRLALTLKGSRAFPDRATLERFGREHRVRDPATVIDELIAAADEVLAGREAQAHREIAGGIRDAVQRMRLRRPLRQRRQDA